MPPETLLTQSEIKEILVSNHFGRIACVYADQPYIVPITYVYDGNFLYGQTNEGAKLEIIRLNPIICFQVDRVTDTTLWQTVIITGKFEELEGEEAAKARQVFIDKAFPFISNSIVPSQGHTAANAPEDSKRVKHVVYRIRVETMNGYFENK